MCGGGGGGVARDEGKRVCVGGGGGRILLSLLNTHTSTRFDIHDVLRGLKTSNRDRDKGIGSFIHVTVVDILERLTEEEVANREVVLVVLISNIKRHHKKGIAQHLIK